MTKKTPNTEEEKTPKKKPAAKKTTAKKTTAKKTETKTTAKKTTAKPAAKKTTAKKTVKAKEPAKTPAKKSAKAVKTVAVKAEEKTVVVAPEKPVANPTPAHKSAPVAQPKPQPQVQAVPKPAPVAPAPKPAPVQPKPQEHVDRHGHVKPQRQEAPQKDEKTIRIVGQPTVKELAEKMNIKTNDFIKKLMTMGIFATINQRLETDMIELIVDECGFKAELAEEDLTQEAVAAMETEDNPADLKPRSPVITTVKRVC